MTQNGSSLTTTATSVVYVQDGWRWRENTRIDPNLDANAVGTAITALLTADGTVHVDTLIDTTLLDSTHPLHQYFAQHRQTAVRQWHREQGRRALRSLRVVWLDPTTGERLVDNGRAFLEIGGHGGHHTGTYQCVRPCSNSSTNHTPPHGWAWRIADRHGRLGLAYRR